MPTKPKPKTSTSKVDPKSQPAYMRENYFPPNASEIKENFSWLKFTKEGQSVAGVVSRKFTDHNDKKRIVIYDESRDESFGLPDHVTLTSKFDRIPIGSSVIIVCVHVGTGQGNPFQYRVAVTEFAPLPEPAGDN
jgi:hypothetical protein